MTQLKLKGLFLVALSLFSSIAARAYDCVNNGVYFNYIKKDGSYYKYTDNLYSMEVTYKDGNYNSYSGSVEVPQKDYSYAHAKWFYPLGIGEMAFWKSTELTDVTFADEPRIAYIGHAAFYGCTSLTSVSLSRSQLMLIDSYAFYNCRSLTDDGISFPSTLDSIGNYAFYNCKSLTKVDLSNTKLTTIADYAFYGCSNLEEIILPSTVTSIGEYAFYHCYNLKQITIPSSVTSIKAHAFDACTSLTSITIPSSVTSIKAYAFDACTSLTSITIPSNVTYLEYRAFEGCTALTDVVFNAKNCSTLTMWSNASHDAEGYYYFWQSAPAFYGCTALENVTFGDGVETIPAHLFDGSHITFPNLKKIMIPSSVKTIEEFAFCYCDSLEEVAIDGSSLISIGNYVFYGSTGLKNVTINGSSLTSIGHHVFYKCTGLETINIPSSVNSIGVYPFYGCTSLTTVENFGNTSITETPGHLFDGCSSLEEITLPTTITSFGENTFYGCSSLTTVNNFKNLSITEIPDKLFQNCSSLEEITIPSTITSFGTDVFHGCSSLTTVNNFESLKNITKIPDYTFSGCSSLEEITIPSTITSFGTDVFYGCTSLTTVNNFTDLSIMSVPDYLFYNCSSLANIIIPSTVTSIGDYAFYYTAIPSFEIPSGVTSIGVSAFEGAGITAIDIPSKVTSIGEYAFAYCASLAQVDYNAANCTSAGSTSKPAFYGCDSISTVIIGEDVLSFPDYLLYNMTYLTNVEYNANLETAGSSDYPAFYGCKFLQNVTIGDSVTVIPPYFLKGDKSNKFPNLKSITLPSSISTIGEYAFYECASLKEVNGMENTGITSLPDYAFYGCSSLKEVDLPSALDTFGTYVFYGCTSLARVGGFGDLSITKVPDYLFYNCTSLEDIGAIPNSVDSIGEYSFYATALPSVTIGTNVKYMGSYAFRECKMKTIDYNATSCKIYSRAMTGGDEYNPPFYRSSVDTVTIASNVTYISDCLFSGCTNLTTVNYNAPTITSGYKYTFQYDTSIETINIDDNVKYIPTYMFGSGLTKLKSITIPANVTKLGGYAFKGAGLTDVIYNATNCTKAATDIFDGYNDRNPAFYGCDSLTNITIGEGVKTIPAYLFDGYSSSYFPNLTSITIPSTVTSIGEYAFFRCGSLEEVSGFGDLKISSIADYTFDLCSSLKSIEIPSSVTSIGDHAFAYCSSLQTIDIPSTVTSISSGAFYSCTNLTTVNNFENLNITSIADGLFEYDASLSSITIPASVTSIEEYAFMNCKKINTFYIPKNVTSIGRSAFDGCSGLETIYAYTDTPAACDSLYTFRDVPDTCVLYVPAGAEENYGEYSGKYDYTWSSLSTVRTFHLLDVVAKADPDVQGNAEGYGYMTYYNGKYTYTLPEGMKASTVTALGDEDKLVMAWEYKAGDVIPANTAVVLYGPVDEFMAMTDYDETDTTADKYGTIVDAGEVENNWLHGVWDTSELLNGEVFGYDENGYKTTDGFLFYTLNYTDVENGVYENIGFYWGAANGGPFEYSAKKAWLAMPTDSSDEAKYGSFLFGGADNEATGIKVVDTSASDRYGTGDGCIYNLAGQRVNDMNRRGIYIVNGRKVAKK